MENFDIPKIVRELCNDSSAVEKWREIYDALNLSAGETENLTQRKNFGLMTSHELFSHTFERWTSENGKEATIDKLETVLRDLRLTNAAGMYKVPFISQSKETFFSGKNICFQVTKRINDCKKILLR